MPGRRTSQMVAAISSRGTASGGGLIVALLTCHLAARRGGFLAAASCGPAPFQALQDGWQTKSPARGRGGPGRELPPRAVLPLAWC